MSDAELIKMLDEAPMARTEMSNEKVFEQIYAGLEIMKNAGRRDRLESVQQFISDALEYLDNEQERGMRS
jgi:hypothetical protein